MLSWVAVPIAGVALQTSLGFYHICWRPCTWASDAMLAMTHASVPSWHLKELFAIKSREHWRSDIHIETRKQLSGSYESANCASDSLARRWTCLERSLLRKRRKSD